MPAPELDTKVAELIARHLKRPEFRAGIIHNVTIEETADLSEMLLSIGEAETVATNHACSTHLVLVDRIDIAPGDLRITISEERLVSLLDVDPTRVVEDHLSIAAPFQHRKRGVETKLSIGTEPAEVDITLLRNLGHAHRYFDLIRSGKTIGEIAELEGFSKRRVQQLVGLAFLAPDVIRAVREGRQPPGLTSDWLLRHAYSAIWSVQRDLFSTL